MLRDPAGVGAVAASGRALARRMVEAASVGAPSAPTVIEVGAGTGAFTGEILGQLAPGGFVALEPNPRLAARLRARFPTVDVAEVGVETLSQVLESRGYGPVDVVVSGLPFALWSTPRQRQALSAMAAALRPGGRLVTFGYLQSQLLPAARRFRGELDRTFEGVHVAGVAWWNLPPALVWSAVKPAE